MMKLAKGQSLLGLMISLSLSSLLLVAVVTFFGQMQRQNYQMQQRLYLQSELQRVIQLIGKDLRRSGFRAVAKKLTQNNLSLFEQDEQGKAWTVAQSDGERKNSCVLFFYDLDASGCIGTTYKAGRCMKDGKNTAKHIERELFGYRLNRGMLETRLTYKNSVNEKCREGECRRYLMQPACNGGGWVDMFDGNVIEVTKLLFEPIMHKNAIHIYLAGRLKKLPDIEYETDILTVLLNHPPFFHKE